jgi:cephalosporin hydroxylase
MKLVIDTELQSLAVIDGASRCDHPLYSKAAFEVISRQWLRVGWSLSYYMNFSWFGLPVLQIPEDLIRLQEVIHELRPDVVVETGVYRGGSLLFHAAMCELLGKGRVVGVDLHLAAADRDAIRQHALAPRITLIEGNSTSAAMVGLVGELILPGEVVLVILDSSHTKDHVREELESYSRLVTSGSYIVVADGLMRDLADVPGGKHEWATDNPLNAVEEFVLDHPEFEQAQPAWPFHEGPLTENVSHWPGGWLRRRSLGVSAPASETG